MLRKIIIASIISVSAGLILSSFFKLSPMHDGGVTSVASAGQYEGRTYSDEEIAELVAQTHELSSQRREEIMQDIIASDTLWPHGEWGDLMWSLVALYQNERVEEANARLLEKQPAAGGLRQQDRVRIICFFNSRSPHYPGRLTPETERAMLEAHWDWISANSKVAHASLDYIWNTDGTENHDLQRKPAYYLISGVFKDHPEYAEREYEDGYTAEDHYNAWNEYYKQWLKERATKGIWIEIGSTTYQKYSYPGLLNLYDLSPDPEVRKRAQMLLDLAFIEEAQISVEGRRGGGRSRSGYGQDLDNPKKLFYGEAGNRGGTHSKTFDTSHYQVPAAAILLHKLEFPARTPFVISNRVPGETTEPRPGGYGGHFAPDSALINYAYRTPHYLLGCTLQNPALAIEDPERGEVVSRYGGISRQNRWSGILFHDPEAEEEQAIYPVIERTRGGRPQHPYWNFQHQNVMLLQRIPPQRPEHPMRMGSYSTGKIEIRFHGRGLQKIEEDGWIFAGNEKGFAGVKFLDSDYQWDDARVVASPLEYERFESSGRILFHAGDVDSYDSFDRFRERVLNNSLNVRADGVNYRFGNDGEQLIEFFSYDPDNHQDFILPRANGESVELRPEWTYQSPFLQGRFSDEEVTVKAGPVRKVYDFGNTTIRAAE